MPRFNIIVVKDDNARRTALVLNKERPKIGELFRFRRLDNPLVQNIRF
jgi:hypothetical protein